MKAQDATIHTINVTASNSIKVCMLLPKYQKWHSQNNNALNISYQKICRLRSFQCCECNRWLFAYFLCSNVRRIQKLVTYFRFSFSFFPNDTASKLIGILHKVMLIYNDEYVEDLRSKI